MCKTCEKGTALCRLAPLSSLPKCGCTLAHAWSVVPTVNPGNGLVYLLTWTLNSQWLGGVLQCSDFKFGNNVLLML